MTDLTEFPLLFNQSPTSVFARMSGDLNAGLTEGDEQWVDATEGGPVFTLLSTTALEGARLWDAINVFLAMCFPQYAQGPFLDFHADTVGLARNPAVQAAGLVTFSGTNGTLVPTGTQVEIETTEPDQDTIVFATTAGGTIASGVVTLAVQAVLAGMDGNVAAGHISILVSPIANVTSVTNTLPTSGGAEVESDSHLRDRILEEFRAAGGGGSQDDYKGWVLDANADVGFVTVVPIWLGPGTVRVIITDPNNDPVSQAVVDRVQNQLDPFSASSTTTGSNTLPTGSIALTDASAFAASGKVVIDGTQLVTYTGKSTNTLTGCTGGSGTFLAGTKVTQGGLGNGKAPIGAIVTVSTAARVLIAVTADLTLAPGYSFDGLDGGIAVQTEVTAALSDYIDALAPGDDVILARVIGQLVSVQGVYDVASVSVGPQTTLTAPSTLPDAVIDVQSTEGFAASGTFDLAGQTVTYTGKTALTFTGGSGGTGTFAIGAIVKKVAAANYAVAAVPAQVPALGVVVLS